MVNYRDPVVVALDYVTVSKLWHAVAGLYFWEFVTTLDYEWNLFRRRRAFRWTIWVYFITRIATLLAVVLSLVAINVTARYNCKVETFFELIFGFLATASASILIVLRILAIWNMKGLVIAIATGAWGTGVIFQIQSKPLLPFGGSSETHLRRDIVAIARTRVESIPGKSNCVVANPHILKLNALVILPIDITLLLIMFFGLIRQRFHKSSALGMGRLLWRQGLVWLLAAVIADILPVVLICLDLNFPLDEICMTPSIVALTIAATRIHRSLVDYASVECTEQLFDPSHSKGNVRK
ncbi:hypothetical protein BGY98DRAFT_62547 [Russula aff. rugulosa BPL654]|nr:hypothetical protein BGY98DRAFT_62547 [Russula aff. rugulosa BPL654]